MIVFLDTNIFFDNWYVKGARFTYLFNYVKNTGSRFLLSELVVAEVENIYNRNFAEAIQNLNKDVKELNFFLRENIDYDLKQYIDEYNFKKIVTEKYDNIIFVPYGTVSHEVVVDRALKRRRPFQQNEKGYRDTLIWLSLLLYLRKNNVTEEVAFLTKNVKDFYDKNTTELLQDLKDDVIEMGLQCKISVYDSLFSFTDTRIDKLEHKYTHEEVYKIFLCNIESELEEETAYYVNNLTTLGFKNLLRNVDSSFPIFDIILRFNFEVHEGIEDPELIKYKVLTEDALSIEASYNLRICSLSVVVPASEYYAIDIDTDYYAVSIDKDEVTISYFMRPDFVVSYDYNVNRDLIEQFNISKIDFYKRQ